MVPPGVTIVDSGLLRGARPLVLPVARVPGHRRKPITPKEGQADPTGYALDDGEGAGGRTKGRSGTTSSQIPQAPSPLPTGAMADMYESAQPCLDEYLASPNRPGTGRRRLFCGREPPAGLDLFDSARLSTSCCRKLVRSYALDAVVSCGRGPSRTGSSRFRRRPTPNRSCVRRTSRSQSLSSAGEGEDVRLTGEGLAGAALVVDGRVIHLSAFRAPERAPARSCEHVRGKDRLQRRAWEAGPRRPWGAGLAWRPGSPRGFSPRVRRRSRTRGRRRYLQRRWPRLLAQGVGPITRTPARG